MSEWIVERTALADPRIDVAFSVLGGRQPGGHGDRAAVRELEDELDARAWAIQDAVEGGNAVAEDYLAAFARARAAGAVGWAMDDDALRAAVEAVYEAQAATGELGVLRPLIEALLA